MNLLQYFNKCIVLIPENAYLQNEWIDTPVFQIYVKIKLYAYFNT